MTTYSLEEWQAEAARRGQGNILDCPFTCPLCGNVATPRQFQEAGSEPAYAAQMCIGRVTGAKGGLRVKKRRRDPMPQPCDWISGGLFTTLGKGVVVITPEGKEVDAFPFAERGVTA